MVSWRVKWEYEVSSVWENGVKIMSGVVSGRVE